jgi:hypothetical protein
VFAVFRFILAGIPGIIPCGFTNKKSHNPVVITKSLGGATVDYVDEKGEFPLTDMSFGTVEIDAHKIGGIIKASGGMNSCYKVFVIFCFHCICA